MIRLLRLIVLRLGPIFLLIYFSKEQSTQVAKQVEGLTNYVTIFQQRTEMGQVAALLGGYFAKLNRPPPDLGRFLSTEYTTERDMSFDLWGEPFRFSREIRVWYLVSCGPDRACGKPGTDQDNLRQKIR